MLPVCHGGWSRLTFSHFSSVCSGNHGCFDSRPDELWRSGSFSWIITSRALAMLVLIWAFSTLAWNIHEWAMHLRRHHVRNETGFHSVVSWRSLNMSYYMHPWWLHDAHHVLEVWVPFIGCDAVLVDSIVLMLIWIRHPEWSSERKEVSGGRTILVSRTRVMTHSCMALNRRLFCFFEETKALLPQQLSSRNRWQRVIWCVE